MRWILTVKSALLMHNVFMQSEQDRLGELSRYMESAYALIHLDLQHHLFSLTLGGKLYLSPLGRDKPVQRALDAGTGTGVWAIDFADAHPETQVRYHSCQVSGQ
jgi:methylase of polypeptide subunit release factors